MVKTLCTRYVVVMIGFTILCAGLAFALDRLFEMQWPSGVNMAIVFVTAMITGMSCYAKLEEIPDKKTMWKLAAYFTIIQFALAIIVLTILIQIDPAISNMVGGLGLMTWVSIAFFAGLIILLLNRFGFSFGINQAKKLAEVKTVKE